MRHALLEPGRGEPLAPCRPRGAPDRRARCGAAASAPPAGPQGARPAARIGRDGHVLDEGSPRPHRKRRRGRSSVGRALESHSRGRGFDSPRLHHPHPDGPFGSLAASVRTEPIGSIERPSGSIRETLRSREAERSAGAAFAQPSGRASAVAGRPRKPGLGTAATVGLRLHRRRGRRRRRDSACRRPAHPTGLGPLSDHRIGTRRHDGPADHLRRRAISTPARRGGRPPRVRIVGSLHPGPTRIVNDA